MISTSSPLKPEIEPVDVAVGARIRFYRKTRGLSQSHVAAKLGVSFQQIQKYERGTTRVSASMMVKVAEALGVSISALFGEVDPPSTQSDLFRYLSIPGAPTVLLFFSRMSPAARQGVLALCRALAGDNVEGRAEAADDAGDEPEE